MSVPKHLPNRDIWAKEAANTLPPLPATEPVPPVVDDTPVIKAMAPIAAPQPKQGKPRHK